jgi:hypothetical protein
VLMAFICSAMASFGPFASSFLSSMLLVANLPFCVGVAASFLFILLGQVQLRCPSFLQVKHHPSFWSFAFPSVASAFICVASKSMWSSFWTLLQGCFFPPPSPPPPPRADCHFCDSMGMILGGLPKLPPRLALICAQSLYCQCVASIHSCRVVGCGVVFSSTVR